ncbi:MAG: glycoside hydrolase family 16 protein [Verrucomicrobia bacterium]|nr:glycoside hydrolase family 16 protein [Verrucomicrobiota bacterium]MBV8481989.1 glycoside hydrolase family 16 protein [Verrucomicrobiota bacterium]
MNRTAIVLIGFLLTSATYSGTVSSEVAPPGQALSAGFQNLTFDEEFKGPMDIGYGTTGHKWNAGLWWEPIPSPIAFSVSDSILTITAGSKNYVNLCTQYHDASGGTQFLGGYFEARMLCTDWSAFWLFCVNRPHVYGNLVRASNPLSWTNEIDIIETDPGSPSAAFCTLHANSSGDGGVRDELNNPHRFSVNHPVLGAWHTYGLLWTQDQVTWYVDNVKVASVRPFPSTWQPMQLILTAAPGGVNGSASTVLPPITQVQWVRVWEK